MCRTILVTDWNQFPLQHPYHHVKNIVSLQSPFTPLLAHVTKSAITDASIPINCIAYAELPGT